MITVGIDTSRSYNRKNPPGGKVSDVFSFDGSSPDDKKPGKINRQRSSIDLGLEPEAPNKSLGRQTSAPVEPIVNNTPKEPTPEAPSTKPADEPKPQVQPKEATTKAPAPVDEAKVAPEPKQTEKTTTTPVQPEPKTTEVLEPKPEKPEPKVIPKESTAASDQNVKAQIELTEKHSVPAPVEQVREAPAQKVSEEPAVASVPKVPEPTVIQTAPVAKAGSRRVPPGGHCSQLW